MNSIYKKNNHVVYRKTQEYKKKTERGLYRTSNRIYTIHLSVCYGNHMTKTTKKTDILKGS